VAQYKVDFLPAELAVKRGKTVEAINTIEGIINKYASQGFELVQVAQISVMEAGGCFHKEVVVNYNMLVFRK
jgi:hypothetical protein